MTLHAPNGLKLIMMERFEGLTSKVDCEGDDGKMSLTFQSKEAFDFALKEWAWINADKEKSFVLVANHDGCGPDSERQAYRINQVNHDEASLTTALDAMPAPWDDVAGTYDLDFGKVADPSVARRLRARNLLDDALETVKDAADAVGDAVGDVGDANLAKSVTFGIGVGTAGQRSTIFKEPSGKLQLDCVNCFLKGSFQVNGRLTTDNFQLKSFTLDAAPVDVSASLELEATLKGSVKGPGSKLFNASKELFAQAIPGAGISVPKIFTLGAVIEFAVAAESSISGEGNFTFGLSAAIPNGAKVITDLTQPELSSQTGFGDVNVVPKFDINKLEGGVSVGASAQPKLTFGVDVLKIGRLETSLVLKLPKVTSDLKGVFGMSKLGEDASFS
ncbi:MAG: hypothetical protein M1832_000653 [Thelocarpon impressellum]|nr:MAG: hypothetical protein M1832_000653 [Thelocarpon impressellum]